MHQCEEPLPKDVPVLRALLLPRYSRQAAASRQRFYSLAPYLESSGLLCSLSSFFADNYLFGRFNRVYSILPGVVLSYWRRIRALRNARKYDVVLIQAECLPYIPAALERWLIPGGVPCVYDYDDAWFHRYDQNANPLVRVLLGRKIARLMSRASAVITGSTYLSDYAKQYNAYVHLIPTTIDLALYPVAPPSPRPGVPFTIGWIGSPSTTVFLKQVDEVLAEFCSRHVARVVVIGANQRVSLNIPGLTHLRWAEETEVEYMSAFDVGIMPLTDTPFERGKCAFKLVQYMGCWKSVIASPVGENTRVVEDGVNGFLAATPAEWMNALERLYADVALRTEMGKMGRAKVEQEYNFQVVAPRLAHILRCAMQRASPT